MRFLLSVAPEYPGPGRKAVVPEQTADRGVNAHVGKRSLKDWRVPVQELPLGIARQRHRGVVPIQSASSAGSPSAPVWPRSLRQLSYTMTGPRQDTIGTPASAPVRHRRRPDLGIGSLALPSTYFVRSRNESKAGGYFWMFARQNALAGTSEGHLERAGVSNGQYGGSQAGAILSIPLPYGPVSDLAIYGRLGAAMNPWIQEEIAVGARVRPLKGLPLSIHAEQRFSAETGGDRGTAFFVAGGTGPDHLIEKVALETYVQGGYVFGENHTHFFDGSATLLRPVAESDRKTLAAGAGLWVGGQRRIGRLDIGPRGDVTVPLGTTSARIAVDWRIRVAGNAHPRSGAAITVSTSF